MLVSIRTSGCGRAVTRTIWLLTAVAVLCSVPAIAAQQITRVQTANLNDKVEIAVTATDPIGFTVTQSRAGKFIAFDLKGYYVPAKTRSMRVGGGAIMSLRCALWKARPPITRIALSTRRKVVYTTRYLNERRSLVIDVWKTNGPEAIPAKTSDPTVTVVKPADVPTARVNTPPPTAVAGVTAGPVVHQAIEAAPRIKPAQPAPRPTLVAAAPPNSGWTSRQSAEPIATESIRNISLDFVAADINDVLKALARQSGTNIVTGSDVKGQVTVSLNKTSLDEALDYVARLSGYECARVKNDTYLVGSNAGSAIGKGDSSLVTDAMTLRYASAEQVSKALEELIPGMKVVGGAPTKDGPASVLLSGPKDDVARAKDIIAQVEGSLGQSQADAITQVYQIRYSDSTEIGKLIGDVAPQVSVAYGPTTNFQLKQPDVMKGGATGSGGGGSSGASTQYEFKVQPKTLILTGPPDDVKRVAALLEQVDVKPAKILIEAKIVDITNDALRDIGVDLSWSTFQSNGQLDITNDKGSEMTALTDKTTGALIGVEKIPVSKRIVTRVLTLGPAQLLGKLNLMVTSSKAKLLAEPKVAALEGKPANIFIGDEIKYVISIQNTPTGQNIETETAQVGIALRSIGLVGPDNEITLNLHPEVSIPNGEFKLPNGIVLPRIARRFTDSTIRIKDGDTVVVGGLIRDQDILTMSKVPFLGDLPILGQLFQHKSKTKNHSEIVIFITAKLIKD